MNKSFMRKTIVFTILFFLYIGAASAQATPTHTYMIGFTTDEQMTSFIEAEEVNHTYPSIQAVSIQATSEQIADWRSSYEVTWVEEDKDVSIDQTEKHWGRDAVVSERANNLQFTGKG